MLEMRVLLGEQREELELQSGGGVSVLGGAEKLAGGGGCGPNC